MWQDELYNVFITEEDQCYNCAHRRKGRNCPLIDALTEGFASIEEPKPIQDCKWYKAGNLRAVD